MLVGINTHKEVDFKRLTKILRRPFCSLKTFEYTTLTKATKPKVQDKGEYVTSYQTYAPSTSIPARQVRYKQIHIKRITQ